MNERNTIIKQPKCTSMWISVSSRDERVEAMGVGAVSSQTRPLCECQTAYRGSVRPGETKHISDSVTSYSDVFPCRCQAILWPRASRMSAVSML